MPIENYNVPTALFSGDMDGLSTPADVAWLSEQLGDKVVFQKQIHGDHFTFAIGKDMTFFSQDVVAQIQKYNPLNTTDIETFLAN